MRAWWIAVIVGFLIVVNASAFAIFAPDHKGAVVDFIFTVEAPCLFLLALIVAVRIKADIGAFIVSVAAQTVAAYLIPLVLSLVFADLIPGPESIKSDTLEDAFVAAMGLAFGLMVLLVVPRSAPTGRWVWVAPMGFLALVVLWEFSLGDFDVLTLLFGQGEAGWVQFFNTAPTMACLCYSAVMAVGVRWRNSSK
jgi:hypothetical protein